MKTLLLCAFSTLALGANAPASFGYGVDSVAKITFSESLRQETLTTREDSGFSSVTESRSASKGKLSLLVEIPVAATGTIDAGTTLRVSVGGFRFEGMLRQDSSYQLGQTSARLTQSRVAPSGNTQATVATAQLRWDKTKLNVKIEAQIPDVTAIAAPDFTGGTPGKIKAETKAHIEFGAAVIDTVVSIEGNLRRKSRSAGDAYGEVVTVDIKGTTEGKS